MTPSSQGKEPPRNPGRFSQAAEEHRKRKPVRTFLGGLFGVQTDFARWTKGAVGEEIIGRELARLPADSWDVLHDLTLTSRGWNADHLVFGPPGVFVIQTKNLRDKVRVYGGRSYVGRYERDDVQLVEAEARRVWQRLSWLTGLRRFWVRGVVAYVGAMEVKRQPQNVIVTNPQLILDDLLDLPGHTRGEDLARLAVAARDPRTWPEKL